MIAAHLWVDLNVEMVFAHGGRPGGRYLRGVTIPKLFALLLATPLLAGGVCKPTMFSGPA